MRERSAYREWARVLKALGNGARLMIIDRLNEGEASVGELTRLVELDQSTVSKHLAVLRSHGIVSDRRDGNVVYYRLETPCVLGFLSCATSVLQERGQQRPAEIVGAADPAGSASLEDSNRL